MKRRSSRRRARRHTPVKSFNPGKRIEVIKEIMSIPKGTPIAKALGQKPSRYNQKHAEKLQNEIENFMSEHDTTFEEVVEQITEYQTLIESGQTGAALSEAGATFVAIADYVDEKFEDIAASMTGVNKNVAALSKEVDEGLEALGYGMEDRYANGRLKLNDTTSIDVLTAYAIVAMVSKSIGNFNSKGEEIKESIETVKTTIDGDQLKAAFTKDQKVLSVTTLGRTVANVELTAANASGEQFIKMPSVLAKRDGETAEDVYVTVFNKPHRHMRFNLKMLAGLVPTIIAAYSKKDWTGLAAIIGMEGLTSDSNLFAEAFKSMSFLNTAAE